MKFNYTKKIRIEKSEDSLKKIEKSTQDILEREFGDSNVDVEKSSSGRLSFSLKKESFLLKSRATVLIKEDCSGEGYNLDADATIDIPVTTWIIVGVIAIIGLFAFFIPGVIIVAVFLGLTFAQKSKFTKGLVEIFNKISKSVQ